jgi:hypothetical protein
MPVSCYFSVETCTVLYLKKRFVLCNTPILTFLCLYTECILCASKKCRTNVFFFIFEYWAYQVSGNHDTLLYSPFPKLWHLRCSLVLTFVSLLLTFRCLVHPRSTVNNDPNFTTVSPISTPVGEHWFRISRLATIVAKGPGIKSWGVANRWRNVKGTKYHNPAKRRVDFLMESESQ